jgi:hypothetical protein
MSSNFSGNPNNFLQDNYIIPKDPEQKDIQLRTYLNNISAAVNSKDSGLYDATVTVTGQQFVPTFSTQASSSAVYRDVYRLVVDFGSLPNATSKTVAHGITFTNNQSVTKLYGAATDPGTTWIPLPFASPTLNLNISIEMDVTNITVTTGVDRTGFTRSFVVVEWIETT